MKLTTFRHRRRRRHRRHKANTKRRRDAAAMMRLLVRRYAKPRHYPDNGSVDAVFVGGPLDGSRLVVRADTRIHEVAIRGAPHVEIVVYEREEMCREVDGDHMVVVLRRYVFFPRGTPYLKRAAHMQLLLRSFAYETIGAACEIIASHRGL